MSQPFTFLKWHGKKAIAMLVLTVVLALAIVDTAIAFLIVYTDTLTNVFSPATLSIAVSEDGRGVVNDGEVTVYVRAAVVFTWENTAEENTILATSPVEGTDFTYACNARWVKAADGFWYCTTPIAPDANTAVAMLESVTSLTDAPTGSALSVELLLDAIQSAPADAVTESWASGVSAVADDGTLILR